MVVESALQGNPTAIKLIEATTPENQGAVASLINKVVAETPHNPEVLPGLNVPQVKFGSTVKETVKAGLNGAAGAAIAHLASTQEGQAGIKNAVNNQVGEAVTENLPLIIGGIGALVGVVYFLTKKK